MLWFLMEANRKVCHTADSMAEVGASPVNKAELGLWNSRMEICERQSWREPNIYDQSNEVIQ